MRSNLSILGAYNWDNSIFDNLQVPDGVDKDTVINTILMECNELELLYTNGDFLKELLGPWSNSKVDNWDKLNKALNTEYDPLSKSESFSKNGHQDIVDSGSGHSEGNSDHNVAGFNQAQLTKSTNDESELDTTTDNDRDIDIVESYSRKYYGSIGLHTSQQLLEAEIMLRKNYNIYKIIAMDFKDDFCLLVY